MTSLRDYTNPFLAIQEFEKELARFTGAPFAIATDCCSHALELVFRCQRPEHQVLIPCRTYLSVLMTLHKLDIPYRLNDKIWRGEYQFVGTNVWDSARRLEPGMYRAGQIQCLSFGRTKPLEIGRGGCVLTDDAILAERLNRMRYDGRDILKFSPWADQIEFEVGYHYNLRPEEAIIGLNLLRQHSFTPQLEHFYNYPDCRTLKIIKKLDRPK